MATTNTELSFIDSLKKLALTLPTSKHPVKNSVLILFVGNNRVITTGEILRKPINGETHVWGFPGGKIDAGETPFEGAVRELEEETGIIMRKGDYKEFAKFTIYNTRFYCGYLINKFVNLKYTLPGEISDLGIMRQEVVLEGLTTRAKVMTNGKNRRFRREALNLLGKELNGL